jgi:hypothetical protein
MSTIYFSGVDRPEYVDVLAQERAAGMISVENWTQSLLDALDKTSTPHVVDSGSFNPKLSLLTVEYYAQFIKSRGNAAQWYATSDTLRNQCETDLDYAYILRLLPEHCHDLLLWIWQYGSDMNSLHRGLEKHKHIGVGGLVPLLKYGQRKAEDIILSLADIIEQYHAIPHYFGVGSANIVKALSGMHEDFSVDSTLWLVGAKYEEVIDRDGRRYKANAAGLDWPKDALLRQNIRQMKKWILPNASLKARYAQVRLWNGEVC